MFSFFFYQISYAQVKE